MTFQPTMINSSTCFDFDFFMSLLTYKYLRSFLLAHAYITSPMFALRHALVVCIFSVCIYLYLNRTSIKLVFHPDRYHGENIHKGIFFEGWYFKIVLDNYQNTMVVIPGVHMNDQNRHSFIMVAYENMSHNYRFSFESFSSSSDEFMIKIDNEINRFSSEHLIINLQPKEGDDATESFRMNLTLSSHLTIPDLSWLAPGTMGPYSWIPTMQCYHHVLSMKHQIQGSIQINEENNQTISGIGYIEKDWGHSFPSIWIWGQANQWKDLPATTSASLFFSLALIPWYFNLQFAGFLVVLEYNQIFYRFNTYLQSIVKDLAVNNQTNELSFDVYDVLFQYKLHVSTQLNQFETISGAMLYGPRDDRMIKYVKEILVKNLYFNVRLSKLIPQPAASIKDSDDLFLQHGYGEEILFQGQAENVALEITGDVNSLTDKFRQTYDNIFPWNFSLIRTLVYYSQIIFEFLK